MTMQPVSESSSPALLPMAVVRALTSVTGARSPDAPQSAILQRLECDCALPRTSFPPPLLPCVFLGSQTVLVINHVLSTPSGNVFLPFLLAAPLFAELILKFLGLGWVTKIPNRYHLVITVHVFAPTFLLLTSPSLYAMRSPWSLPHAFGHTKMCLTLSLPVVCTT